MHNKLGKQGEEAAALYLMSRGYEILFTNWRNGKYELDLIAKKGDKVIIAEVKTRTSIIVEVGNVVSRKKEKNLIEATNRFLQSQDKEVNCQIDLLILQKKRDEFDVMHIENAIGQE